MKMRLITAAAVMALASQGAWAAEATNTATADAKVTLVTPITVAKSTDLVFGRLFIPSSGTTARTIALNGGVTGDAVGVVTQNTSAAVFNVSGTEDLAYTPTVTFVGNPVGDLAVSAVQAQCTGGTVANNITNATGLADCSLTGGASAVNVGGVLTIPTGATAGTKTLGTITVVVAYN
jgi:hypothetical protein